MFDYRFLKDVFSILLYLFLNFFLLNKYFKLYKTIKENELIYELRVCNIEINKLIFLY